jgi:hypothetical protein
MTVILNDNITEIRYSANSVQFIIGHNRKIIPKLFLPSLIFSLVFLFVLEIVSREIIIIAFFIILILTALFQIREVEFDMTESIVTSRYILWGLRSRKKILVQPLDKFKYEIKYCEIENSETPTIRGYQLSGKRGNKEIDILFFEKQQDLATVIDILRENLKIDIRIK